MMAASITSFSSLARLRPPNASISTRLAIPPPCTKTRLLKRNIMRIPEGLRFSNTRRLHLLKVTATGGASDPSTTTEPPGPAGMAKRLYVCINGKNMKGMDEIISEDCRIEDFSFYEPFEGKKEVMKFFKQLATSMGKTVRFKIRNIEEDGATAWVNWHLEWKETPIPFTRGCSFYEFSREGEGQGLTVRKAQVITESPIKPGGLGLILLKIVTSLFDKFPKAAEWFLRSPHVIIRWARHTYSLLLAPFINPLLESYMNFWRFTAQILFYTIGILIYILKVFFN
ncbi:uncharacterized protein LOC116205769 [Punica granatum]|uniref:Uncharacterized protein LOC116205769 n=1 Tax=Punica granatum TaxID=22663 RepID=A0A6P8DLH5_PUNGR|nr:uncharacterized protein LOC116205769 [Punica granatum]